MSDLIRKVSFFRFIGRGSEGVIVHSAELRKFCIFGVEIRYVGFLLFDIWKLKKLS